LLGGGRREKKKKGEKLGGGRAAFLLTKTVSNVRRGGGEEEGVFLTPFSRKKELTCRLFGPKKKDKMAYSAGEKKGKGVSQKCRRSKNTSNTPPAGKKKKG